MSTLKITAENYRSFKPSELVESFITHVEYAEKFGLKMDMDSYNQESVDEDDCLPCLGGTACMQMGLKPLNELTNKVGWNIASLGDHIRTGEDISDNIKNLYGIDCPWIEVDEYFSGICEPSEYGDLKKQIQQYADELKKHGL